jgi:hypothetical protein
VPVRKCLVAAFAWATKLGLLRDVPSCLPQRGTSPSVLDKVLTCILPVLSWPPSPQSKVDGTIHCQRVDVSNNKIDVLVIVVVVFTVALGPRQEKAWLECSTSWIGSLNCQHPLAFVHCLAERKLWVRSLLSPQDSPRVKQSMCFPNRSTKFVFTRCRRNCCCALVFQCLSRLRRRRLILVQQEIFQKIIGSTFSSNFTCRFPS